MLWREWEASVRNPDTVSQWMGYSSDNWWLWCVIDDRKCLVVLLGRLRCEAVTWQQGRELKVSSFTARTLHCTALTLLRSAQCLPTRTLRPLCFPVETDAGIQPTNLLYFLSRWAPSQQGFVLLSLDLLQEFASASTFNSCRNVLFLLAFSCSFELEFEVSSLRSVWNFHYKDRIPEFNTSFLASHEAEAYG